MIRRYTSVLSTNKWSMVNILAVLFITVGCTLSQYTEFWDFKNGTWRGSEAVVFDLSRYFEQHKGPSEFYINGRFAKNFKYTELLLEVKTVRRDQSFWCDTLRLKTEHLKHHGNHQFQTLYRHHVTLEVGSAVSIRQINAPELHGIEAIGIELKRQ